MLLFEEKSDSNLANVIMGPFITAVLHSFSCIYFWVLLQGKLFLSSLGKLIEGKCVKLGAGVLAKDLALMGTASSLLLCVHTRKREACSVLEVPFEQIVRLFLSSLKYFSNFGLPVGLFWWVPCAVPSLCVPWRGCEGHGHGCLLQCESKPRISSATTTRWGGDTTRWART